LLFAAPVVEICSPSIVASNLRNCSVVDVVIFEAFANERALELLAKVGVIGHIVDIGRVNVSDEIDSKFLCALAGRPGSFLD
jgi:hypothetical protein